MVTVALVGEFTTTLVAGVPPKVTVSGAVVGKFVPVTVTEVPPVVTPEDTLMLEMVTGGVELPPLLPPPGALPKKTLAPPPPLHEESASPASATNKYLRKEYDALRQAVSSVGIELSISPSENELLDAAMVKQPLC